MALSKHILLLSFVKELKLKHC